MADQSIQAKAFEALHVKGKPLILYNVWDAGSAKAVVSAGTHAIATGSHSVASAHGYDDGEALPLDLLLTIVERIAAAIDLPLSVDFEGGFAVAPDAIMENVKRIIVAGAIGINFEDQVVGGEGIYSIDEQSARISGVVNAGRAANIPLFINARTDVFLKQPDNAQHGTLMTEAIERAAAYKAVGAKCFFAPGLDDPDLIGRMCEAVDLPVNIMMKPGVPGVSVLAKLGVARVSHGPFPYITAVKGIKEKAHLALS